MDKMPATLDTTLTIDHHIITQLRFLRLSSINKTRPTDNMFRSIVPRPKLAIVQIPRIWILEIRLDGIGKGIEPYLELATKLDIN